MKPLSSSARRRAEATAGSGNPTVGKLIGFDEKGQLLVDVPGAGKQAARTLLRLDRALRQAVLQRREVLLVYEEGDPRRPIVTGVVQPQPDEPSPEEIESVAKATPLFIEADADGRRVRLSAQEEIVLSCGKASITLRRDGKVIVRGVEVQSVASGTNRLRGGQIRLN
jgi:hypothetical protein